MIILFLFIGIVLGYVAKNSLPKLIKHFLIVKSYNYKVKFNIFMVIHKENCMVSEIVSTDSVEILVRSENEEEVIDFINKIVKNETKVEIESIEIV